MGYLNTNVLSHDLIPPHVNFSHLTAKDYNEMYRVIMTVKEGHFKELGLDACLLEDELNKVPGGTPGSTSRSSAPLPLPVSILGTWIWKNNSYRPSRDGGSESLGFTQHTGVLLGWEKLCPAQVQQSHHQFITSTRLGFSFLEEGLVRET